MVYLKPLIEFLKDPRYGYIFIDTLKTDLCFYDLNIRNRESVYISLVWNSKKFSTKHTFVKIRAGLESATSPSPCSLCIGKDQSRCKPGEQRQRRSFYLNSFFSWWLQLGQGSLMHWRVLKSLLVAKLGLEPTFLITNVTYPHFIKLTKITSHTEFITIK